MEELSPMVRRVLNLIVRYMDEHDGRAPSFREIGKVCGGSGGNAHGVVDLLIRLGYLEKIPRQARGLVLTEAGREYAARLLGQRNLIPLVGDLAAGAPIPYVVEASQGEFAQFIPIGHDLIHRWGNDLFAMRVKGTSMVDMLIDHGDIVILCPAQTCDDGEAVAVAVHGNQITGGTLKCLYHEPNGIIRLQPRSPLHQPQYYPAAQVEVRGLLVGLQRQYR